MGKIDQLAVLALSAALSASVSASGDIPSNKDELITRWGKKVTAANVWREYPRPEMIRDCAWESLNGEWDLVIAPTGTKHRILVPFCVESPLSGVRKRVWPEDELVYKRKFRAPRKAGHRNMIRFEAVDFRAHVFVNGVEAGLPHEGGYTPFSYDITDLLKDGENELEVRVWDPTDTFIGSTGKQVLKRRTCFFTPTSGIWGSVWLETLPEAHILSYNAVSDIGKSTVRLEFDVSCGGEVDVEIDGLPPVRTSRRAVEVKIPDMKLWSPESPHLYRFTAKTGNDSVRGYFAMRRVSLVRDAKGIARIALNGCIRHLIGPLYQGYWSDGYLTPPSEEACRWDLDYLKDIGMNCVRVHIKVESRAFYAHCDRIGLLVLQDMPSAWNDEYLLHKDKSWLGDLPKSNKRYGFNRREMKDIVDFLRVFPSIVCWVPYNEGWSQPDREKTIQTGLWFKRYDPTRLLDLASGWRHEEDGYIFPWWEDKSRAVPYEKMVTDILDYHEYPGPRIDPPNPHRAVITGECGMGGLGLVIAGHHGWPADKPKKLYRADDVNIPLLFKKAYTPFIEKLVKSARSGSSGSIYTQAFDCFWETGFVTFDRAVERVDRAYLKERHEYLLEEAAKAAATP